MNQGKPLSGIRVVELTTFVAAPICGRMLGELGANVVKIENISGDPWRYAGSSMGMTMEEHENPCFDFYNTGKEDIALNLKTSAGMEVFFKLLESADIFITNTRLASLRKLGIDYASLSERFPELIYGMITGYGDQGPDAAKPGFDNVAFWCVPGYMSDMSYLENPYPVMPATGVGDSVTGGSLLSGLLAALYARERTGRGDCVTVSLLNNALWVMSGMIMPAQRKYGHTFPYSRFAALPFAAAYRCSDGERLMVSIVDIPKQLKPFYEAIGRPDLLDDPLLGTSENAIRHRRELFEILDPIFASRPSEEWLEILQSRDIVCSKMGHFSEATENEQAWANDYLEHHAFRNGESCVFPTCPVRLNSIGPVKSESAPLCGEHTRSILERMGYSPCEIDALIHTGVVKQY